MRGLTRRELAKKANCPFYLIDYLRNLGRLPVLKPTKGPGDPTIFDISALDIVRKYVNHKKALNSITGHGSRS